MAILDAIRGVSVWVCIDGKPVEEYEDDEDEEVKPGRGSKYQASRTVRKYIESASDKEFSIRMTVDRAFKLDSPCLGFAIKIDGRYVATPVLTEASHPRHNGHLIHDALLNSFGASGTAGRGNQVLLKKYKFSKIETTTEDSKLSDVKRDAKIIDGIGEIQVMVYRQSEAIPVPVATVNAQMPTLTGPDKVHEKALKGAAKSHSASLGAPEPINLRYVRSEKVDGEDYPIAIFKFKYRSREALKQLLIIERTPSPEPERASAPPAAVNIESLNVEQKAKLDRFLQGLVGNNDSQSPERRIKRERDHAEGSGVARKKRRSGQNVAIDLTADSDEENIIPLN